MLLVTFHQKKKKNQDVFLYTSLAEEASVLKHFTVKFVGNDLEVSQEWLGITGVVPTNYLLPSFLMLSHLVAFAAFVRHLISHINILFWCFSG